MSYTLSARVRSAIFRIAFPVWTAIISTLCLPYMFFSNSRDVAPAGHAWAAGVVFLLRYICGLRYEIKGAENIPKNAPVIFACKHQSVWETMIFLYLFRHPAYILKQELLSVPLFGLYLRKLNMVAIDRAGGSGAIRKMQADVSALLAEGREAVIFPEGTRRPAAAEPDYQPGVAFLYAGMPENAALVPVALNSGKFWSPFSKIVRPGVVVMEYRRPIPAGLPRKEFMRTLQERIEAPLMPM